MQTLVKTIMSILQRYFYFLIDVKPKFRTIFITKIPSRVTTHATLAYNFTAPPYKVTGLNWHQMSVLSLVEVGLEEYPPPPALPKIPPFGQNTTIAPTKWPVVGNTEHHTELTFNIDIKLTVNWTVWFYAEHKSYDFKI